MEPKDAYLSYSKIYTEEQENLIKSEFQRNKDKHYLEHAGATLYSEKQISCVFNDLKNNLYGNPHAKNISSKLTDDAIDQVRFRVLKHFNTCPEEYTVIFTSNATHALKIVGESFNYGKDHDNYQGIFSYIEDNHTSVLGMREYAKHTVPLPIDDVRSLMQNNETTERKEKYLNGIGSKNSASNSLFVYPAQSNFSGEKYPLSWINLVQNGILNKIKDVNSDNWYCVLDAASYTSTSFLDLSKYKPDFVPLSFYKMFGYPTGVGALLVKNSSAHLLTKKYFGGGTVYLVMSDEKTVVQREVLYEKFEDGTLPFMNILAIKYGFETLERLSLSMKMISNHTFSLACYVYKNLSTMHHANDQPVAIIYSQNQFENVDQQGGIINFNIIRPNGEFVGYSEVLHFANLSNIHLRTGCFCNSGACKYYLNLSSQDVKSHFEQGHVCGDTNDIIDGYPTGSVRISFGYMTFKEDVDAFLKMIENCFVSRPLIRKYPDLQKHHFKAFDPNTIKKSQVKNRINLDTINFSKDQEQNLDKNLNKGLLKGIYLYPIKSCGYFKVDKWPITKTGLKYDRQWMIVNSMGVCLTQKHNTYLCLIKPVINLENKEMELHFEGMKPISIPLDINKDKIYINLCHSKVCGDQIQAVDCGDQVGEWLCDVLCTSGLRLIQQNLTDDRSSRTTKKGELTNLSLANQAQFLLINTATVQWLADSIESSEYDNLDNLVQRFRPNLVVSFSKEFVENQFTKMIINNVLFEFAGKCTRCQMICIDQSTGNKTIEPLRTLSEKLKGKVEFGVYLKSESRNTIESSTSIIGYK